MSHRSSVSPLALTTWSLFVVALTASCASADNSSPALPNDGQVSVAGLHYYLPEDELEVEATLTSSDIVKFDFGAGEHGEAVRKPKSDATIDADVILTADRTKFYVLDLRPGGGADKQLTVEQKENGLLASVNTSSTGRVGDVIRNVFSFATTLLTALTGAGDALSETAPQEETKALDPLSCTARDALPADFRDYYFQRIEADPDLKLGVRYEVRLARVLMPDEDKLFLSRTNEGCELWQGMLVHDRQIEDASRALDRLQQTLDKAPANQVDTLLGRIHGATARLERSRVERQEMAARFAAGTKSYLKQEELLPSPPAKKLFHEVFELAELPKTDDVKGKSIKDAKANLSHRATRLLETAGFLISIDPRTATADGQNSTKTKLPSCDDEVKGDNMRIYYRMAEPRTLTVWKQNEDKLAFHQLRHELLVDPDAPSRCLEFKASAFAERKLALTFGTRGQPVKLVRSGTSAAASATAALADAATSARDAYVDTLSKLATAEEKKRALELADLTTDVERLKKEQELLNAEISLEGAAASRDLVLQQRQIEAQLALLEKQLALRQAEDAFDPKVEIAQLQLEVQRLQQQVAILQTQAALEALKKD